MQYTKEQWAWVGLRVGLGMIFLWAFFDKVFGLGFSTAPDKSWLNGVSPTVGFLKFGTKGPFAEFFRGIAGNPAVDLLFMAGLLLIGAALLLGIGMKIAGYSGALMLVLMWLAVLPPEHHPFLDDHIIYAIALCGLAHTKAGQWFGLGGRWANTSLVKKFPFLE